MKLLEGKVAVMEGAPYALSSRDDALHQTFAALVTNSRALRARAP